jgi:two-component system NarL family response regulator
MNTANPAATKSTRAQLRILIVDDSAIIVHCLREYLDSQAAVQVIGTAVNGSEAVRQAMLLKPDLVLMDMNMPGMNGLQATALLRQQLFNTRIILMTLDETDAYKAAARAHGAHAFIKKERLANDLMAEIYRVGRLPHIGSENLRFDFPPIPISTRGATRTDGTEWVVTVPGLES